MTLWGICPCQNKNFVCFMSIIYDCNLQCREEYPFYGNIECICEAERSQSRSQQIFPLWQNKSVSTSRITNFHMFPAQLLIKKRGEGADMGKFQVKEREKE